MGYLIIISSPNCTEIFKAFIIHFFFQFSQLYKVVTITIFILQRYVGREVNTDVLQCPKSFINSFGPTAALGGGEDYPHLTQRKKL